MATGRFSLPLGASTTARQPDWAVVTPPTNNQIKLLFGDLGFPALALLATTTGGVNYTVDWGDGTVDSYASNSVAQHNYTVGTGKICVLGYYTYVVTITSTNSLLTFSLRKHAGVQPSGGQQYLGVLEAHFNVPTLTSLSSSLIPSGASPFNLEWVQFYSDMNACTTCNGFVSNAYSLRRLIFPNSMNSCTDFSNLLTSSETNIECKYPAICSTNIVSVSGAHNSNVNIKKITLPNNLTQVSTLTNFAINCYQLERFICPANVNITGNSISNAFRNNYTLGDLTNLGTWTSTQDVDGSLFMTLNQKLTSISLAMRFSKLEISSTGVSTRSTINSIRLTNILSGWGGTSPQIDISYCSLTDIALNTLFGDLGTVIGKTIKITGNPGAGTCDTSIATGKGWTVTI